MHAPVRLARPLFLSRQPSRKTMRRVTGDGGRNAVGNAAEANASAAQTRPVVGILARVASP